MPCEKIDLPNGASAIVCTRGQRKKKCASCGKLTATLLCDYPVERGLHTGQTCDKPLCKACAITVGKQDFCPHHPAVKK